MPDAEALKGELLARRGEEMRSHLDQLAGKGEFRLKVSYREEPVLRSILARDPALKRWAEQVAGCPRRLRTFSASASANASRWPCRRSAMRTCSSCSRSLSRSRSRSRSVLCSSLRWCWLTSFVSAWPKWAWDCFQRNGRAARLRAGRADGVQADRAAAGALLR